MTYEEKIKEILVVRKKDNLATLILREFVVERRIELFLPSSISQNARNVYKFEISSSL